MSIRLVAGKTHHGALQVATDCPYCNVFARMTPESLPDLELIQRTEPKHVGVVYQCDACHAPVFLRFAVKAIDDGGVELNENFIELERPAERFAFAYLPKQTELLFREALSCYSGNNFNAFASMCRRAAASAFDAMGDGGKRQAFDEVMTAQELADIGDDVLDPIKTILFDTGSEESLPLLNRSQAGVLLEVLKDMFYQCFVRRGKLSRAIKVRNLFVRPSIAESA
jgi:hypothetical protein